MRFLGSLLLLTWLMNCSAAFGGGLAESIKDGDSREQVIEVLGEPSGRAQFGGVEILFFERGQVDIRNGKVLKHTILTPAAFEAQQAQRKAAEEARRRAAAATKKQQKAAAPVVKTAKKDVLAQQKIDAERAAELERRIAEGISQPPIKMSKRKLRKYRRGRSPSQIEQRKQQITEAFEAEQQQK